MYPSKLGVWGRLKDAKRKKEAYITMFILDVIIKIASHAEEMICIAIVFMYNVEWLAVKDFKSLFTQM